MSNYSTVFRQNLSKIVLAKHLMPVEDFPHLISKN